MCGLIKSVAGACTALVLAAGAAAAADADFEFPVETAALVEATTAYFEAIEAQGAGDAKRPAFRIGGSAIPASLEPPSGGFGADRPVRHLTGYRITWYPTDRFLGSVDFMGTWNDNRGLVCGYLTWDVTDPAAPEMVQTSVAFLDIGELSDDAPDVIHEALLEANCAFGEIDANLAFFEIE